MLGVDDLEELSEQGGERQAHRAPAPLDQSPRRVAGHDEVSGKMSHGPQLVRARQRRLGRQVLLRQPPAGRLDARQRIPLPMGDDRRPDLRMQQAGPSARPVDDHRGDAAARRLEPHHAVGAVLPVDLAEGGGDGSVCDQGSTRTVPHQPAQDHGHPLVLHGLGRQVDQRRPLDADPGPSVDHLDGRPGGLRCGPDLGDRAQDDDVLAGPIPAQRSEEEGGDEQGRDASGEPIERDEERKRPQPPEPEHGHQRRLPHEQRQRRCDKRPGTGVGQGPGHCDQAEPDKVAEHPRRVSGEPACPSATSSPDDSGPVTSAMTSAMTPATTRGVDLDRIRRTGHMRAGTGRGGPEQQRQGGDDEHPTEGRTTLPCQAAPPRAACDGSPALETKV